MQLRTRFLASTFCTLLAFPLSAAAADAPARTVEFTAEASRAAPNDLVVAVLYAERSGADAAALAREVNRVIAAALDTARAYANVKTQTAGTSTWPVYGKEGRGRIESWRMRAEIRLEGREVGAVSELIGKLQSTLALAQVVMQPAPETRRKAVDEATVDALRAFEKRGELIAGALGKRYRLYQMSISESGMHTPVYARMRAAPAMAADAAPAPLEGGESQVGVSVTGRVELLD
ncbi:SIMPL domain-containing protein [Thauera sinica]|uniref:SIMPL domain-containing protein n=1 Tax=Thauera sinica TaxID=2665146 RepID=A0ABW1AQ43_9RHOO|nr:SIMPL domain-containing protein [Thauera sp. K11]ATE59563.1 cyclic nucleotide-binding protein [Thauera sp. K11]